MMLKLFSGGGLVFIQPGEDLIGLFGDGFFISFRNLSFDIIIFEGALDLEGIAFQMIFGLNGFGHGFIFGFEFFSFSNHAFNIFFRETTGVICDGDFVLLSSGFINGRDVQNSVSINIKSNLNLGDSTWGRGDTTEFEFTQFVVIFGHGTLTFKDLNEYARLVISISGEGLSLFGGNCGVSLDERSHDTSGGLNTKGERCNIKKQ
eukprot:Sdes_comp19335_c0_seq2m10512